MKDETISSSVRLQLITIEIMMSTQQATIESIDIVNIMIHSRQDGIMSLCDPTMIRLIKNIR